MAMKDSFMNTPTDEDNAPDIFNISIIFADSEDSDIKQKAIENVKTIISNSWYGWSSFKDAYTYLDFYSVTVVWYKEFLLNEEYIECRNTNYTHEQRNLQNVAPKCTIKSFFDFIKRKIL